MVSVYSGKRQNSCQFIPQNVKDSEITIITIIIYYYYYYLLLLLLLNSACNFQASLPPYELVSSAVTPSELS